MLKKKKLILIPAELASIQKLYESEVTHTLLTNSRFLRKKRLIFRLILPKDVSLQSICELLILMSAELSEIEIN